MQKTNHHTRLSIDISPEYHRLIKISAATHNQPIREYVLEAIKKTIDQETENEDLRLMASGTGIILKELWENQKDADYDKL